MTGTIIGADELRNLLDAGAPVRLLDVRWRIDKPDGRDGYRAGHLPGAVFVDLEGTLTSHGGPPTRGRHPLPERADLEEAARSWGIDDGDIVVVYDDNGGLSASRAWWLLRWAGVEAACVLDGGFAAWRDAGYDIATGETVTRRGGVHLTSGRMPTVDIVAAAEVPARGVLLDARAPERYRGETEPIDPVAGHIPGALNVPSAGNLGPDGRFLPAAVLRERFAAVGARPGVPVATYCGSGVTATANILALALAGVDAALYPGSWSEWANNPDLPVATGEETPSIRSGSDPIEGVHR